MNYIVHSGELKILSTSSKQWNAQQFEHTVIIHVPLFQTYFAQVKSMDDNCGKWVECMGVASGCGEQEVGVASGSGWNLWVWLLGVVVRRYIDFLMLLIPTPLVMHFGPAAYVLGPPPSRGRDLELEGEVNACHVEYLYESRDSHVRGTE